MAHSRNQYHFAIRRTTRCGELQQAKSLFEASLSGDMDLIKEMKKVKSGCQVVKELPDIVGGAEGEQDICEKFKEVLQCSVQFCQHSR